MWAWGSNYAGQLGDGTWTSRSTPTRVLGLTVAAGWGSSMAVRSDGTVWGWGDNSHGQLGTCSGGGDPLPTPVQAPGLSAIKAVSRSIAGMEPFTLALRSDGTVWGMGTDYSHPLGQGESPGAPVAYCTPVRWHRAVLGPQLQRPAG